MLDRRMGEWGERTVSEKGRERGREGGEKNNGVLGISILDID